MSIEKGENPPRFNKSFMYKFESQEETDFSFKFTNGKILGVHKVVLARKSKLFDDWFNGPLKKVSPVDITDFSYDTFKKLIEDMYGIHVEFESAVDAVDYYHSAQTYNCPTALQRVWQYMTTDLTDERVEIFYKCAKIFKDEYLLKELQKFYEPAIKRTINSFIQDDFKHASDLITVQTATKVKAEILSVIDSAAKDVPIAEKISKELGLIQAMVERLNQTVAELLPDSKIKMKLEGFESVLVDASDDSSESSSEDNVPFDKMVQAKMMLEFLRNVFISDESDPEEDGIETNDSSDDETDSTDTVESTEEEASTNEEEID